MKLITPNKNFARINFLMILICFLFTALIFSGCSSSEGKAKKKKAKEDDTEITETEKETEKTSTAKEEKKEDEKKGEKHDKEHNAEKGPSSEQLWAEMMEGNKQFVKGKYNAGNLLAERPKLAKGQQPHVIVLGCSDSRVPPELIFGKNTGDLFVVRDAGNIVDELALGSMEYAVEHLHAKMIVVLGHENCGAVAAAVGGEKMPTSNLQAIVNNISPAFEGSKDCEIGGKMNNSCVELNVQQTAKRLLEKSSVLKEAVEKHGVTIVKAIYRFETGEVVKLD